MEFKHPPRDVATEAPSNYQGLDFQTQALQMSKVGLSWDEDEPHRAKTLNHKYNPDQLAELEKQQYIADYSGDESDESNDDEDGGNKYRALIGSGDVKDSDNEEEENENEKMDMEVTFHDGLEDLSKTVREKKERKKSETVWDKSVREIKEKKKARKKNKKKNDSSSDDDKKAEDGDDFFMEEAKPKKKAKKKEEVAVEEKRNIAELELLLADDENGNGGEGVKGYNIKKKKKIVEEEEKIVPMVELDQPRFATKLFSDPNYALDPTDPQFKRSATYVRQLAQKQKEIPRSQEEVKEATTTTMEVKPESKKKTERHETSNAIKSVKMKMKNQQKDSEERKKKTGNAESSSTTTMTLAKIKKKLKDLSKK